MINLPDDHPLRRPIERAWNEIQAEPQHRLRVATRLELYDALVGDLGVPMRDLWRASYVFPKVTKGLKRYWYLGLRTMAPLLPLWEREIRAWLVDNPDGVPMLYLPTAILSATKHTLRGVSEEEVHTLLDEEWEYWCGTDAIHMAVGNVSTWITDTAAHCLYAVYEAYSAVWLPPIHHHLSDTAYDEDISTHPSTDVAHYAQQAVLSNDAGRGGPEALRAPQVRLEFWRWWIFELLPEAAAVDVDALGWNITLNTPASP